jgi:ATP-binding cassette subfamily C protein CydD
MFDKRIVSEARPKWGYLIFSAITAIGISLLAIAQAWIFSRVVAGVFLEGVQLNSLWRSLFLVLGIILLRAVLQWFSEVSAHEGAYRIITDLRERMLHHIFSLGPIYAQGERNGELLITVTEGIESLEEYFSKYLTQLINASAIPLIILAFVFPLDWRSGCILLVTGPLIPFFMMLIGKLAEKKSLQQWQSLSRMSAHFLDILRGMTTLKVFNRDQDQTQVIGRVSEAFRKKTLGVLQIAFLSSLTLELLATLSTALAAVSIGLRLVNGTFAYSQGLFILLLAPDFFNPLRTLAANFHAGLAGVNAYGKIAEILDMPVKINLAAEDSCNTPNNQVIDNKDCSGKKQMDPILPSNFNIMFQQVVLTYQSGENPSLNGISLDIKSGEKVALVGHSGAGKTSIAKLLLRFMDPTSGAILVDGVSLTTISPEKWLEQIAYLPQNPHLFAGSIAENICLGHPSATREEVVSAAIAAQAHNFIEELPDGYQTILGEGGTRLSGGQVQRIAIARAFLKNAPFLILDEATSSLDSESDYAVQQALKKLLQGKTALMIAHRMSTIQHADRIYVLNKGQIVEQGHHETLIQEQGYYYRMFKEYQGEGK